MMPSLATCAALLLVAAGAVPLVVSCAQFLLVGLHRFRHPYDRCGDCTPRVAFVVPAWNEGASIGNTVDCLMRLSYPAQSVRVYVVDDASTDDTPEVLRAKVAEYPGRVFHLRRERGGQGKAATLNHGLQTVLDDTWAEAIAIMDADVLFAPATLRRMARHFADPAVGAVTAYVKEGSRPGSLLARFIAFEYIAAQAAARRAQNITGALVCMAGGAQLHTRQNLLDMGGRIDTSSLAEDTFTTFRTQLNGRRALFDGNAVVWAEEPDSLVALWKQRLRWARGNLQLSRAYRSLWLRPGVHPHLGGVWFALVWFSAVAVPLLAVASSLGLVWLDLLDPAFARRAFDGFWVTTLLVYMFITVFSFAIDPSTGRRSAFEGLIYPGLVSLLLMASPLLRRAGVDIDGAAGGLRYVVYCWSSLSMLAVWGIYRAERAGAPRWLRNALLVVVGYGALNGAVAVAAMAAEWRNADMRWDKTPKSGKSTILE